MYDAVLRDIAEELLEINGKSNLNSTNITVGFKNNDSRDISKYTDFERNAFPKGDSGHLLQLTIATGALIILLNSYIISLFVRFKILRHKQNIFPANMTVSDVLVGLIVIPLFVISEETTTITDSTSFISTRRIDHQSGVLLIFNNLVSIYSLAAVISHRAIAICFPLRHRQHFTARKAVVAVVIIWLLSLVFSAISFAEYKPLYDNDHLSDATQLLIFLTQLFQHLETYKYYDDIFISLCFLGTTVSGIALLGICVVVRNSRRRTSQRTNSRRQKRMIEESKTALMLSFMFAGVLVWVTVTAYLEEVERHKEKYLGMNLGRFALSIFNPVLYTLMKSDFQEKAKEDLFRVKNALQSISCKIWLKGQGNCNNDQQIEPKSIELQIVRAHSSRE